MMQSVHCKLERLPTTENIKKKPERVATSQFYTTKQYPVQPDK